MWGYNDLPSQRPREATEIQGQCTEPHWRSNSFRRRRRRRSDGDQGFKLLICDVYNIVCINLCAHTYVYIYIYVCIHIYIYMYIYIYIMIYNIIYIYTCILYICMYPCMHLMHLQYIHLLFRWPPVLGDPFEILVDGPGAGWHRWNHCCRYQLCFFSSQPIVDILSKYWKVVQYWISTIKNIYPIVVIPTWWLNQKNGEVTDSTNKKSGTLLDNDWSRDIPVNLQYTKQPN